MTTVSDYDTRRVSDVDAAQDRSALRELAPSLPGSSTATLDDDVNDAVSSCPVLTCPVKNCR